MTDPFALTHNPNPESPGQHVARVFGAVQPLPGIYGWSPGNGGVHYHRVAEPIRVAAQHDIRTGVGNRLDNEVAEQYDTILVHMLHGEHDSEAWRALERADCHRLIFDIDDAMWAPDAWAPFREHYTPEVMARVYDNIRRAHVVTTPSPYIAEHVSAYNPNVWVVPNTVPADAVFGVSRNPLSIALRPGVVGYQGSSSHVLDWSTSTTRSLVEFLDAHPHMRLHLFGPDQSGGWDPDRVDVTAWQPPGLDYYRDVAQLDVGIAPTRDTEFNRGKSGLRAIEYAALGIVGVFPRHEIYRDWTEHGATAYVLSPGESLAAGLAAVVRDPGALAHMSRNARIAAQQWTTEEQITRWTEAWNSGH